MILDSITKFVEPHAVMNVDFFIRYSVWITLQKLSKETPIIFDWEV